MKKKCVVSFANSAGNYVKGLARLNESLRNNFDGDFLGFIGEASCGAPLHTENPYAFKIYCLLKAFEAGYEQVLWLDSSCFAIKNIQSIFDVIGDEGYIAQDAGHFLSDWCNDETLNFFYLTREKAKDIKMIGNAGFLGLSIINERAWKFFHLWKDSMECGMFKGSWDDHRHDMSCSSAIWHQLNMKKQSGNEWLQYAGPFDETANDKIYIKAQGL